MDFIIAGILGYVNGLKAKKKGYGAWKYGLLTFFGYMIGEILCLMFLIGLKYNGALEPRALLEWFSLDISRVLLVLLCGVGAFLAVRFLIEKMPDKNIKDKDKDWLENLGR
jgi:hypothetical protein